MSELVVGGLVKHHAAWAGEIEAGHEALRKMVADHHSQQLRQASEPLTSREIYSCLSSGAGQKRPEAGLKNKAGWRSPPNPAG